MKSKAPKQIVALPCAVLLAGLCVLAVGDLAVAGLTATSPAAASSRQFVAPVKNAPMKKAGAVTKAEPMLLASAAPTPTKDAAAKELSMTDVAMKDVPPLPAPRTYVPKKSVSDGNDNINNSIDEKIKGKMITNFRADGLELKSALAAFAKQNNLNIVPDNDIAGTVTVDVHDLPLDQMMNALLEAGDCSWREERGLIRVRNMETRTFAVDYLRLSRKGVGASSATLNSATSGDSSGGSSGGGGGSSGGGGGSSGGSGNDSNSGNSSSSSVNLNSDNSTDFWEELKKELEDMLSEDGKKHLQINKTAGIIEVNDRPSVLRKVEHYLNSTEASIHRQVDIEVKMYDVSLNDQFQFGIDWNHVVAAYGGSLGFGGSTLPVAIGGAALKNSALGGLNTIPGLNGQGGVALSTLVFSNLNTAAAVNALKEQGNVEVLAKPRIRTMNNQTALVKVGQEQPFFSQTTINSQSAGGNQVTSGDTITTITVGTILSITPQISSDGWISMDISPVLTSLVGTLTSPSRTATAPVLDTKQASTLVRVRDGMSVVLGGLIQTEKSYNDTKVPILGDIPFFGKLFTGTFRNKVKKELVIFVTPHIVDID